MVVAMAATPESSTNEARESLTGMQVTLLNERNWKWQGQM
jgi:hypothetical protein